ncbi:MAG: sigma-70 family RNA polymerase sigma factor [Mycobacteriales bacterium]
MGQDPDVADRVTTALVVRQALAALPPRQRSIVVMRYLDDLTEAQTAKALGCSIGTIKSQNARALQSLRQARNLNDRSL